MYHYGKEPEEFYDPREDPLERDDIVDRQSEEKLARMREELLQWPLEAAGLYSSAHPGEEVSRNGEGA